MLDARAEEELEDISYTPSLASEIGDDLGEGEREDLGDPKEGVCPAPGAGDIAKGDPKPRRNRPITPLRVFAYGKPPDCEGRPIQQNVG